VQQSVSGPEGDSPKQNDARQAASWLRGYARFLSSWRPSACWGYAGYRWISTINGQRWGLLAGLLVGMVLGLYRLVRKAAARPVRRDELVAVNLLALVAVSPWPSGSDILRRGRGGELSAWVDVGGGGYLPGGRLRGRQCPWSVAARRWPTYVGQAAFSVGRSFVCWSQAR